MADTTLMSIPGQVDPVPVARDITPRADGRIDLIGLPKDRIRELFAEAGLDAKQAKLRAKQVFHWLYHRGVTDFAAMTDIAKTMRPCIDHAVTCVTHVSTHAPTMSCLVCGNSSPMPIRAAMLQYARALAQGGVQHNDPAAAR